MKISLSFSKTSIKNIIKKYKSIAENIDELEDSIIGDLKEVGLKEINNSIGNSQYVPSEPVTIIDEKAAIGIKGTQAIYDEYGTGTVGMNNPHPEKPNSLNPYNSGKTIRENKKKASIKTNDGTNGIVPIGGLYWTFNFKGEKIYTQGRPAGMHVYKAKNKIKDDLKNIVKRRVGEYLSKR